MKAKRLNGTIDIRKLFFKVLGIIFLILITFNCKNNNTKESKTMEIIDEFKPPERIDIIKNYDINALVYLFTERLNENLDIFELLPDALYIAETTNDPLSYKFIYFCTLNKYSKFSEISNNHLDCFKKMTLKDKEFVKKYLTKGVEQKDKICENYLMEIMNIK
jgi:hypothetical protein